MTALLHFDKLFQIPLILAHGISGISYRDMIEAFMAADPARFPLIAGINAFFHERGQVDPAGRRRSTSSPRSISASTGRPTSSSSSS